MQSTDFTVHNTKAPVIACIIVAISFSPVALFATFFVFDPSKLPGQPLYGRLFVAVLFTALVAYVVYLANYGIRTLTLQGTLLRLTRGKFFMRIHEIDLARVDSVQAMRLSVRGQSHIFCY